MTLLKTLYLQFLHPTPHSIPVNIRVPPSSGHIVSSTLLRLDFHGPCNYLEDLLSRITTPSLECTRIKFDSELPETPIDISQLSQFLYRVESQRLPDGAKVSDGTSDPYLSFTRSVALPGGRFKTLECLRFGHYAWPRLELPMMTQICQQISPFLPSVQALSIPMLSPWHDGGRGTYWVDFLRVFNRLEKLHLCGGDPSSVVHAPLEWLPTCCLCCANSASTRPCLGHAHAKLSPRSSTCINAPVSLPLHSGGQTVYPTELLAPRCDTCTHTLTVMHADTLH
ncbi:hypothetical protein EDB85DRAFT_1908402 [Lactarius pseudohatsudake]|nr:hypothetical protein EDB85DRAFT_2034973 [Lactarius pseudohatsudake]KAH9044273.1 hypothetical protein EDB85DRAFT_1908402 [Lactarius pseudohatsudake]